MKCSIKKATVTIIALAILVGGIFLAIGSGNVAVSFIAVPSKRSNRFFTGAGTLAQYVPRADGVTATMLDYSIREAEKAGYIVSKINLYEKQISFCTHENDVGISSISRRRSPLSIPDSKSPFIILFISSPT